MNRTVLAAFLMIMLLMGCKSAAPVSQAEEKDLVEGIVFVTFVMRDDSSENRIELVAKTIIKQKMKADPQASTAPNRVLIRQLDTSGNTLSMIPMDHPLYKRVEFANEKGEFESKIVKLTDAEFFARVTLFGETKFIQVEEELSGKIIFTRKFNIRD